MTPYSLVIATDVSKETDAYMFRVDEIFLYPEDGFVWFSRYVDRPIQEFFHPYLYLMII